MPSKYMQEDIVRKEVAVTICRKGNEIRKGCSAVGTQDRVSLEICCPPGFNPFAIFHTHPNKILEPSEKDLQEARRLNIKLMCIGDGEKKIKCHEVI